MSNYSDENEFYIGGVKVLTSRSKFSRAAHFFFDEDLDEFPAGLRQAIDCADRLQTEGYIHGYEFIDPVATYNLTEEGEELVDDLIDLFDEIENPNQEFDYNFVLE